MVIIESIDGTLADATITGRFVDLEGNAISQQTTQQAGTSGAFTAKAGLAVKVSVYALSLR